MTPHPLAAAARKVRNAEEEYEYARAILMEVRSSSKATPEDVDQAQSKFNAAEKALNDAVAELSSAYTSMKSGKTIQTSHTDELQAQRVLHSAASKYGHKVTLSKAR